jgi:hypothetical protein
VTAAKEEAGRVLNEMIDICYDTPRIVKVLGGDGAEDSAAPSTAATDAKQR